MPRMRNAPVALSKETLLEILTYMLEGVRTGDTLEGSIEFLLPYPPAGDPEDADFMVMASYRHGNRQGQGGLRLVGQMVEVPDEEEEGEQKGPAS